jgi:hypothetical protein
MRIGDIEMLKGGACLVARRQGQGQQLDRRAPERRLPRELRRRRGLSEEKRGKKHINAQ